MIAIEKEIIFDENGEPKSVVIPWSEFCDISDTLGLDLDEEARKDLRAARSDWDAGKKDSFVPLSEFK